MKKVTKTLAIFLALAIVMSQMAVLSFAVNADNEIASVTAEAQETLIENYNGYWKEGYDSESDTYKEYFYYYISACNPIYTVTHKDGTVITGDEYEIHNKTGSWPDVSTDQSYNNQLTIGKHTAEISVCGVKGSLEFEIVENPIASVTAEVQNPLIENYDGSWKKEYDSETGTNKDYFYYNLDRYVPIYTVTYKDGTVITDGYYKIYNETGFWPDVSINQSYNNQLTVGKHTAEISVCGVKGSLEFEIVENPIESLSAVYTKELTENVSGHMTTDWETKERYFSYNCNESDLAVTAVLKDGTVLTGTPSQVSRAIHPNSYPTVTWNQSSETPWKLGKNTATLTLLGKTCDFEVEVVKNPYISIEILEVEAIQENASYSAYDVQFSYKITKNDGSAETGYYYHSSYGDGYINLGHPVDIEIVGEWGPGKENQFIATVAGVKATGYVEIVPKLSNEFEYIELDGGAIITKCLKSDDHLVIPDKINGLPVIGISYLGTSATSITVSDSVIFLENGWLSDCRNVKEITIGSSVKYLNNDMFTRGGIGGLEKVTVSANNAYYADIDGKVYNKEKTTLVVYPLAADRNYTVPAGVTNIDLLSNFRYDDVNITFTDNSNGMVTLDGVTYTSDMKKVLYCNPDKTGAYKMPDSVTEIRERAFADCSNLESVVVSKNVTDIVYGVFADCTSLKSIDMPNTIKSIEKQAFVNAESLEGISLGNSLTVIGDMAFDGCASLKNAAIPNSVTEVGHSAFENCVKLSSVTIPNSVNRIGHRAFAGCVSLAGITIPNSVTYIGGEAFENCRGLTHINLSSNIVNINSYVFRNCTSLTEIEIPNGVESIEYGAFDGCTNLRTITLPDSVTDISSSAFSNTGYYNDEGNWENGVLYIGKHLLTAKDNISGAYIVKLGTIAVHEYAFYDCTGLTSVTMPNGLTTIGEGAFRYCTNLEKADIPDSVKHIGNGAFEKCTKLKDTKVPKNLAYMGDSAFSSTGITSVTIPDSVTDIVYGAFENCTNLSEINMPNELVHIGGHAFDNTEWYNTQPDGIVKLGRMVYDYKGIIRDKTSITVDSDILGIADYAFEEQTNLTGIVFPNGLLDIGEGAFSCCRYLESIKIPGSVTTIRDRAFINCSSVKEISLENGVQTIGESAFANCSKVDTVTIPASVTEIGYGAFMGCSSLKEINVSPNNKNYKSIDGVLYTKDGTELIYCPAGKTGELVIPEGVNKVKSYAFADSSLSQIIVMNDNIEIEPYAFATWNSRHDNRPFNAIYLYGNKGSTTEAYAKEYSQLFVEIEKKELHDINSNIVLEDSDYKAIPENTELRVENTETKPDKVSYNITLITNGKEVQPNGSVTVRIPVPANMNGADCKVYRQEADGTYTDMNAVYQDGYMVFTTDHFSVYVLTTNNPNVLFGDTNADGTIDDWDSVLLERYLAGWEVEINTSAADIDKNGVVDDWDGVLLARKLAGWK